jgi:hypothetical protein
LVYIFYQGWGQRLATADLLLLQFSGTFRKGFLVLSKPTGFSANRKEGDDAKIL